MNASLVLVEGRVPVDEFLLVFGDVFEGVNGIGSAGRNAGAAVDAAFGIDVHLGGGFEFGLVQLGMDTVGGANIDAERILDAVIGYYVGHDESISNLKWEHLLKKECKKATRERAVILITGGCDRRGQSAIRECWFEERTGGSLLA